MTEEKLISLVEIYQTNRDDSAKKRAVAALSEFLYTNLHRFRLDFLTEDTRSDFIVNLYPRFEKLIEQFDPARASFGTYIRWIVRLSYRSFVKNRYVWEARQRIYEAEETTRLMSLQSDQNESGEESSWTTRTCDSEQTYCTPDNRNQDTSLSDKKKEIRARKIFLLACKAGMFLDENAAQRVSELTGYSIAYIRSRLDYIQKAHSKKMDSIRSDQERKNSFYIRTQRCLYEMKYLDKDSSRYLALEKEYRYCVKRRNDLLRRSSRQIRTPSNRFLAGALGMSRGTIDATLASVLNDGYLDMQ